MWVAVAMPLIVSVPAPKTCIGFAPRLMTVTARPTDAAGSLTESPCVATVETRLIMEGSATALACPPPAKAVTVGVKLSVCNPLPA